MVTNYLDLNAQMPDQLTHYVESVAGLRPQIINGLPLYIDDGNAILAAITPNADNEAIRKAVDITLENKAIKQLTVLAKDIPPQAPANAKITRDNYWILTLPPLPGQKIRNLLKSASRQVRVTSGNGNQALTTKHIQLAVEYKQRKKEKLDDGMAFIFSKIEAYAKSSPNVQVFSAYMDDHLAAYAIADFTSLNQAFYMFAFRSLSAPSGTADLALEAIIAKSMELGYDKLNLGLGIDQGIEFFKKKWGAVPEIPYVETSWAVHRKNGFLRSLSRLFHKDN